MDEQAFEIAMPSVWIFLADVWSVLLLRPPPDVEPDLLLEKLHHAFHYDLSTMLRLAHYYLTQLCQPARIAEFVQIVIHRGCGEGQRIDWIAPVLRQLARHGLALPGFDQLLGVMLGRMAMTDIVRQIDGDPSQAGSKALLEELWHMCDGHGELEHVAGMFPVEPFADGAYDM
jgi:hypothetical protein